LTAAFTTTVVDSVTLATVYVPLKLAVDMPLSWMVAPGCGAPCATSVTMVRVAGRVVLDAVTDTMSLLGQKSVPDDQRNPLPDWYRKTFLDWRMILEPYVGWAGDMSTPPSNGL
jgi:hypothetical protein